MSVLYKFRGAVWEYCKFSETLRLEHNGEVYRERIDDWVDGLPCVGSEIAVPAPTRKQTDNATSVKPSNPKDAVGSKKVSMSVLPANVLMEVALGLQEGALKYGRHNYRAIGVRTSVYYDATMRHLMAFWEGEDIDPDSQLSHVTKAISSLIVLRDSMLRGNCTDDRPPKSSENWIAPLNERASALVQRYAGTDVKHYFEKEEA